MSPKADTHLGAYLLAIVVGTVVSAIALYIIKRPLSIKQRPLIRIDGLYTLLLTAMAPVPDLFTQHLSRKKATTSVLVNSQQAACPTAWSVRWRHS